MTSVVLSSSSLSVVVEDRIGAAIRLSKRVLCVGSAVFVANTAAAATSNREDPRMGDDEDDAWE